MQVTLTCVGWAAGAKASGRLGDWRGRYVEFVLKDVLKGIVIGVCATTAYQGSEQVEKVCGSNALEDVLAETLLTKATVYNNTCRPSRTMRQVRQLRYCRLAEREISPALGYSILGQSSPQW